MSNDAGGGHWGTVRAGNAGFPSADADQCASATLRSGSTTVLYQSCYVTLEQHILLKDQGRQH